MGTADTTRQAGMDYELAALIGAILSATDDEARGLYSALAEHPGVQRAVEAARKTDAATFDILLRYPLERFVEGLLASVVPGDRRVHFLFKQYQFVEAHLKRLFAVHEGDACSVDKARTVVRRLIGFFQNGTLIAFDWTAEFTYHYPHTILTTHEAIVAFFEGLYALYYGQPEKYLIALRNLEARSAAAKAEREALRAQARNAPLKAFQCGDEAIYAARDAAEAAALYRAQTGEVEPLDEGYPVELSEAELDRRYPVFDEDEQCVPGQTFSIRELLAELGDTPGWLCATEG